MRRAVKGIGEYWNTYLHNPKEVKFFLQKTAWQWLDPWFEALTMNGPSITVAGGVGWLATALGGGVLFAPVQAVLRALLTFVYLFAGCGTLALRRKTGGAVWAQLLGIAFSEAFSSSSSGRPRAATASRSLFSCCPWLRSALSPRCAGQRISLQNNCKIPASCPL